MIRSFLVLSALAAAVQGSDSFCDGRNIEVVGGSIQLARQWGEVFAERFENGIKEWKVENYRKALDIGVVGEGRAGNCLRVANRSAKGDTAFEVSSRLVRVRPGAVYRFRLHWRANVSLGTLSGHKGHCLTQLQWRDASDQPLEPTPFRFGPATAEWRELNLTGIVPANAASVVVRIGFDSPNLNPGEWLALDDIQFEQPVEPAIFERCGSMTSRPLRVTGDSRSVTCNAEIPAGTAIRLRVASAPDEQGGPGDWSEPVELDAWRQTQKHQPWVRYSATLETADPTKTPVLKRVSIGNTADGPWQGRDCQPPSLAAHSATRTADAKAPIWFRFADETGVDRKTVRLALDDRDVTRELAFAGGKFVYRPSSPLKPPAVDGALARWRVSNYNGALTIDRTARRTPDAPPGFHITRQPDRIDTSFSVQSPEIPVIPRAHYRLGYWTRHSMDLKAAMSSGKKHGGSVTWLDTKGVAVGQPTMLELGAANTGWHQDVYEMDAPDGASNAVISFGFDQPDIFGGAFVDIAEIEMAGPRPARRDDSPNLHRMTVSASDFAGNAMRRDFFLLVRSPRTRNVVSLRDDGMTLVDGKPFFPIGLYAVWKKAFNDDSFEKAFGDLRAAGFNLAHTYNSARSPAFAEFYSAAQRHGIKLFVASGGGANCKNAESVLWDVLREESQPALLAWYLADDTASHIGDDELCALSDAIHDVDPAHITVQADGVGSPPSSRYTDYVKSTDGFLPEIYPIRDNGDKGVPQVIADMKTIASDLARNGTRRKTIWALIQDFEGWGWPRFPTRAELWAMSYLSIIHGAHGITWYTYGGTGKNHGVTHTPETWRNICELAGELSQLQDVMVERTGPQPPPPQILSGPAKDALGYPSISALLKEHAGHKYILAANSANADVVVRFSAAGAKRILLPFEKRQLRSEEGGFTDTFGPYGVHIYHWK